MAEKIVERLHVLDKQAKILLARRITKNSLQSGIKEKTFLTPLTFDFQLELEKSVNATSTSMVVSKSTEDKSQGIKKAVRKVPFKNKPESRKSDSEKLNLRHFAPSNIKNKESKSVEPVEENLKSRSNRSFLYLKDINEVEYAKPLPNLYSQHRQECRRILTSTISSPIPNIQSNVYKKEKDTTLFTAQTEKNPKESYDMVGHLEDYVSKRKISSQMNDFYTKGNKPVKNDQLTEYCSVEQKSLLPLCFEDELKKPNAKIIISPAKTVTSHTEQNDTNPIIFHDPGYVQKFLLTKYRFIPHPIEYRNVYPCRRANSVLERNHEILKSLINDKFIASSKPKRTMPTAWRKGIQAISFEVRHRVGENKLKKKTTMRSKTYLAINLL